MAKFSNWSVPYRHLTEDGYAMPTSAVPSSTPGTPGDPMNAGQPPIPPQGGPDPSVTNQPTQDQQPPDVSQDPVSPEMPEEPQGDQLHFEDWRNKFFKESIKGNTNILIDMLNQVRDRDLHPDQRKFVEDNLQIQFVRQQSNVSQASKEIRKAINEQLDKNSPATSVVPHIDESLQKQRMLVDNFLKISGYYGMKGEIHRKYIAALLGGVQVGGGIYSDTDVIINDNNLSINLCTRMSNEFGKIGLGTWSLHASDPERFLSDPEKKRLSDGSPEEREVLRHRVVMDSVVKSFAQRGMLITVTSDDGTVYNVGWDVATCLKAAYVAGKLVVRTKQSETSEVMFDEDGHPVTILDLDIRYVKNTGEVDEDGKHQKRDVPFIERRDGMLFLVADLNLIREASHTLQGLVLKEIPYQGNPSDLSVLTRCVYSTNELLMRQC